MDLTGQVVADSIGHRIYCGVGGQMDFIRGAALGAEGRAIIALPSTAAGGTVARSSRTSRWRGRRHGRAHVRTVVTGMGRRRALRTGPARNEQAALIGIAHPDDRDRLRRRRPILGLDWDRRRRRVDRDADGLRQFGLLLPDGFATIERRGRGIAGRRAATLPTRMRLRPADPAEPMTMRAATELGRAFNDLLRAWP